MKNTTLAALAKQNGFASTPVRIASSPVHVPENPTSRPSGDNSGIKRRVVSPEKQQPVTKKPKRAKAELQEGSAREGICRALLLLRGVNINEPLRIYVAIFSGYSNITSTGFAKALKELKQEDMIEYPKSKAVRLTEKGISSLPPVDPPKDNSEVHERLLTIVKKAKGMPPEKADKVFRVLSDGKAHTRQDLAAAGDYTNVTSSGFTAILSTLRNLGLTQIPTSGYLQLTDIAFPYGRDAQRLSTFGLGNSASDTANGPAPDTPAVMSSDGPLPVTFCSSSDRSAVENTMTVSPEMKRSAPRKPKKANDSAAIKSEGSPPVHAKVDDQHQSTPRIDKVGERICKGMVMLRASNNTEPTRAYVALFSGFKNETSGTFSTGIASLNRQGIIECTNGTVRLTEFGIHSLPSMAPPQDNAEMQKHLQDLLKAAKHFPNKIDALFELLNDGSIRTREDVAAVTGFTNVKTGNFNTMLSSLKKIGIIHYPGTNAVQLADIAFPYGRPTGSNVKVEAKPAGLNVKVDDDDSTAHDVFDLTAL